VHAAGNVLTALSITSAGVITTLPLTWGGSGTILALASDGRRYAVADSTGIWIGPVDGSTNGVKNWNLSAPTNVELGWVKQRLMGCIDRAVYELTDGGGLSLPAAKYTHPTPGWIWTSISEDPSAILIAGYAGGTSGIMRFELVADGGVPTLVAGAEVAQMPAGEIIYALRLHAGSFLAICTSRGLRVGTFNTFSGKMLNGKTETGLLRVDIGTEIDDAGRKAYAQDLVSPTVLTGEVVGVDVTAAGRIVFVIDGYGLILEGVGPGSARPAWLRTSRIRFSTVEPKVYRFAQITGTFNSPAQVIVYVSAPGLAEKVALTWTGGTDPEQFNLVDGPRQWAQLRFELVGATCELVSYSIKALPAASRQRMLQYVLLCNDRESDRNGQILNQTGYAKARLLALEALEDAGAEVQVQEILPGEDPLARRCVIDRITYRQAVRPTRSGPGRSGVVLVVARTIS
jgi:hypothetical protein